MEPWQRNFRVVWAANFVTAIGMTTFLPLFPLHLREIGVVDGRAIAIWSGALVAAAPLTAAFMGPLWGALGDRIGRKPMLLRANVAITLFVGAMGFATTPWLLLLLRLLQGVFSGFIAPAMTLVSVSAPPQQQGRIAGTLHTSVLAGNIVGPALGGFIGDHWGHRLTFFLCAALSIVAAIAIAAGVTEVAAPRAVARADGGGEPAGGDARGRGLGAAWRDLLRDAREFVAAGPLRTMVLGVLAVRGGAVLVDPVLALFLGTLRGGHDERLGTTTGLAFGATAAATLLVTPLWGRLGDERGHGRLLGRCGALAALCLLPQAFVGHVAQLGALRFASGIFLAGVLPSAFGLAASLSSIERRGAANGFMFSAIGLANALGPMLGGLCASGLDRAGFGVRPLFVASAALVFAGAWWLRSRATKLAPAASGEEPC
ncbi:MAG: MFS transporter [Planctomycetes bacterium]|nr:MFS transporter [Planctomycetota bacterium]